MDQPFKAGDLIDLDGGKTGYVADVGLLVNFALPDPSRAIREEIGVG